LQKKGKVRNTRQVKNSDINPINYTLYSIHWNNELATLLSVH